MRILLSRVKKLLPFGIVASQTASLGSTHYAVKVDAQSTLEPFQLLTIRPQFNEYHVVQRPITGDIDPGRIIGMRVIPFNSLLFLILSFRQNSCPEAKHLCFYLLDPATGHATHAAIPDGHVLARSGYNAVQIDSDRVLLCGGMAGKTVLPDCYVIDVSARLVTRVVDLPSPLRRFSLNLVSGRVFLVGGTSVSTKLASNLVVYEYQPLTNEWSRFSMFKQRSDHTAIVIGDSYLFLYGGVDNTSILGDPWLFDVAANKWYAVDVMGSIPRERAFATLLVDGDYIYVGGGSGVSRTILRDCFRFSAAALKLGSVSIVKDRHKAPAAKALSSTEEMIKHELLAYINTVKQEMGESVAALRGKVLELSERNIMLEARVKELEGFVEDAPDTAAHSPHQGALPERRSGQGEVSESASTFADAGVPRARERDEQRHSIGPVSSRSQPAVSDVEGQASNAPLEADPALPTEAFIPLTDNYNGSNAEHIEAAEDAPASVLAQAPAPLHDDNINYVELYSDSHRRGRFTSPKSVRPDGGSVPSSARKLPQPLTQIAQSPRESLGACTPGADVPPDHSESDPQPRPQDDYGHEPEPLIQPQHAHPEATPEPDHPPLMSPSSAAGHDGIENSVHVASIEHTAPQADTPGEQDSQEQRSPRQAVLDALVSDGGSRHASARVRRDEADTVGQISDGSQAE